jgi:hypothetical protein
MRMWNIDPKLMCNKHILGEHLEMHMFIGSINKGKSITGFIETGLVEVGNIKIRHDELVSEMESRGVKHRTRIIDVNLNPQGKVNSVMNKKILSDRCSNCKKRIDEEGDEI